MKRVKFALLAVALLVAACTSTNGTQTPGVPTETVTVSASPFATPTETATPTATSKAQTKTPTPDDFLVASPTVEFCEAVPIEYEVIVDVLNKRAGPWIGNPVVGQLARGDTFIGTLCSEPDPDETYQWVQHSDGSWVVYWRIGGGFFLE